MGHRSGEGGGDHGGKQDPGLLHGCSPERIGGVSGNRPPQRESHASLPPPARHLTTGFKPPRIVKTSARSAHPAEHQYKHDTPPPTTKPLTGLHLDNDRAPYMTNE